jgi:hypothetical protein
MNKFMNKFMNKELNEEINEKIKKVIVSNTSGNVKLLGVDSFF